MGIDPGFSGAVAIINAAGTTARVWDMPVTKADKDRKREIDLEGLDKLFGEITKRPACRVGLEFPTTRPGEGAERCERFGRQKGYLEAFAYLKHIDYRKIAPQLWKGRLGLPGKTDPEANKKCAALFDRFYPDFTDLIRGPRGGIKDGRMDALLIAHFLRTQELGGMQSIVDQFGKNSTEAASLVLGGGKKRKKIMHGV